MLMRSIKHACGSKQLEGGSVRSTMQRHWKAPDVGGMSYRYRQGRNLQRSSLCLVLHSLHYRRMTGETQPGVASKESLTNIP